jgi:hypothetical protein
MSNIWLLQVVAVAVHVPMLLPLGAAVAVAVLEDIELQLIFH